MSQRADLYNFVKDWGDKTERALISSAKKFKVRKTGGLISSISGETSPAGGKISFELSFDMSGRFVDMGAGRGASISERRAARRGKFGRNPKKWYGPAFYSRLNPLESGIGFKVMEAATQNIKTLQNGN